MMKPRLWMAALVAAFGVACLNYTKAFGVDHHYEFAEESGWPKPSGLIYFLGLGATLLGTGCLGFDLGRRKR